MFAFSIKKSWSLRWKTSGLIEMANSCSKGSICIDPRDDHVRQNKYVCRFISGELACRVNVAKDRKFLTIFFWILLPEL